jgi:adenylosuccinate lyase
MTFDHTTYLSPLTWRYGSAKMRGIWSEVHKRKLYRRFWVALAEAQQEAGLVTVEQVADLRARQDDIDIARATEIEQEIHHDLMAEIKTFAEQCPVGGAIIHLGATSMDVIDNVDTLRVRESLALIIAMVEKVLDVFATRIEDLADVPAMAYTHIQPAEPTTIGYRLAQYAQDLLVDWAELSRIRANVQGKGLKGAVGTSASYTQLLANNEWTARQLEAQVMKKLELEAFPITTQTYPRKQDWLVINALAGLAATLHKFAFDIRILQSPPFGEWSEPFGLHQVGSSAMPFKRNPINSENIDSLTRWVAMLPRVAWDDAAFNLLERTLDDSANRRLLLPQAFLVMDEMLRRTEKLVAGMKFNKVAIARNLQKYGAFAALEAVLVEAVQQGGDRQSLHERLREHSLAAWQAMEQGEPNPLVDLLAMDKEITRLLSINRIQALFQTAEVHVGDAGVRARELAITIRTALE